MAKTKDASEIRNSIQESKFNRQISFKLRGYRKGIQKEEVSLYTEEEITALEESKVQDRLPPRATKYYMDLASKSSAITNLIKARPNETEDLSGEADPSNQLRYSPVPGLLHKYELILLYVVRACSSWCRYCYRSDFLTNKTEKDIAKIEDITDYIKDYNEKVRAKRDADADISVEEKFTIKEALLSGGDPMILSNKNLFDYIYNLANAGIRTIRIGTKELAFFPERFDDNFFHTLDILHDLHPQLNFAFMVHFTHPDEILFKDDETLEYIQDTNGHFKKIPIVENAVRRLRSRSYVTLENQTPIIDSVNDDAEALKLLQVELKGMGINNHYYFQCREIEGHRVFAVPVEKAWKIHSESQRGLSGIEKSRFALSSEEGKLEVVSIIDAPDFDKIEQKVSNEVKSVINEILGEGLIVFKFHRTPNGSRQGDLIIAKRNAEALWISGYEDRILYDGRKERGQQFSPLVESIATLFGADGDLTEENIKVLEDIIAA